MSIMQKLNLFTAILATSFSVGVVKDTTLNATNFSEFTQLSNGDYSHGGRFGSITDELASYDIDILDYQMGFYGDSTLMAAPDDENNFYIYIYESEGFQVDYDKVSIGYYEGELSSWDTSQLTYLEFDLTLVAFDETGHIFKYHIDSFTVSSNTDYVVLVRQIYQYSNRDSIEFIRGVGLIYQFDYESQKSKCTTEETIEVTNKLVGYSWYPWLDQTKETGGMNGNYPEGVVQRNFVAFNTSYDIEDLQAVRLKYDGYYFAGEVNVGLDVENRYMWGTNDYIFGFDDYLHNKNLVSYLKSNGKYTESFDTIDTTITPSSYSFSYDLSTWWSSMLVWQWGDWSVSHSYEMIAKTDTITEENDGILSNDELYDYEWIVTFDNRLVKCAFLAENDYVVIDNIRRNVSDLLIGIEGTKGATYNDTYYDSWAEPSFYDNLTAGGFEELYNTNGGISYFLGNKFIIQNGFGYIMGINGLSYADTEYMPIQVEDLTILELTWKEDGEIKFAIAVDGYTDSSGGIQIDEEEHDGETIGEIISDWFNDAIDWVKDLISDSIPDWVIWLAYGLITLAVLWVVFKVLGLIISLFKK